METQPCRFGFAFRTFIGEKVLGEESNFSIAFVSMGDPKFCLDACAR